MHVLHLHSSFEPGGKELRAVRLINAFGKGARHTIVSAVPEALGAGHLIDKKIDVAYPRDFPSLVGKPWPGRLQKIALAMKPFDLILTYNWGAMDAVLAYSIFGGHHGLPPLVHHEDGFNEDEADGLKPRRNWFRRVALAKVPALVVPSQRLKEIALEVWQQPHARVHQIGNGIDLAAFAKPPKPTAVRRLVKRRNERWVGTLAGLRQVKNLPALVRAFAALSEPWQLVILGEGPEREAIRKEAERLDLLDRVHLPGFIDDPSKVVALFDIFALSSHSEQMPISLVEAMAASVPVASPDVGDVAAMLSAENREIVVPAGDEDALAKVLVRLAGDEALRRQLGEANRARAERSFDEDKMIAAYRALYARAVDQESFP